MDYNALVYNIPQSLWLTYCNLFHVMIYFFNKGCYCKTSARNACGFYAKLSKEAVRKRGSNK